MNACPPIRAETVRAADRGYRRWSRFARGMRDTRHVALRGDSVTADRGFRALCPPRQRETRCCAHRDVGRHSVVARSRPRLHEWSDAASLPEAPDGSVRIAPQGDMSDTTHTI